jgi:hypothetical protein
MVVHLHEIALNILMLSLFDINFISNLAIKNNSVLGGVASKN